MIETSNLKIYGRHRLVNVLPFSRQYEGEEVIIGRVETGIFLAIPRGAVEVLEHLANGKSVGEATDLYQEQHGAAPDLGGFLAILETNGIVEPIGEDVRQLPGMHSTKARDDAFTRSKPPANKRYHFSNFSQAIAQRIFSRPVIGFCLVLIAIGVFLLARDQSLWPNRGDLYYTSHRTLIFTFLVIVSYGSVVFHEFAHLISARAIGVNSRIGFGNRLYDLVVETDLTGLWSVPKRQRYLPLMAGCLLDGTIGALLVFVLYAHGRGWIEFSSVILRVWRALLFTYVTRVFWQWFLFVRTDYYYVIATFLNCRNLLGDTEALLSNQFARVFPWIRPVDQSAIPAAERRIIPFYAVIWIAGRILALYWLYMFTIPVMSRYMADLARSLARYSANPADFWDSLTLVFWLVVPISVGGVMWIRNLARRSWSSLQRNVQHG